MRCLAKRARVIRLMRPHVLVGWIIAAAVFPATGLAQTSGASFAKDVAPILYAKCVMCHRPGEVAPMSLRTYDEVRPWARAIKSKVVSREMPPWHAEGGEWRNDRRLSQAEIANLVAWVDAGAPRGNDRDTPPLPQFAVGWNHPSGRPPDVIIEAPEMKVPAEGESPWQFAYVKSPLQGEVWVSAVQVVPGNRPVVHHVMVTSVTLPPGTELDAEGRVLGGRGGGRGGGAGAPPSAGTAGAPLTAGGAGAPPANGAAAPPRPNDGGFNGGWEPGVDTAIVYPQGVAERIGGTHFNFNLHYQPSGKETTDKTRVGLWLEKGPVTHEVGGGGGGLGGSTYLVDGKELTGRFTAMVTQDVLSPGTVTVPNIPPFADNYRLTSIQPVRQQVTLYTFQPHMHLRGKSMKYTVIFPDGREEVILNVPKYDFNWQIIYALAEPLTLPGGSVIRVEAVWDNSAKNKYNPKPEQEVRWGEQSWDEMFAPIVKSAVQLPSPVVPAAQQSQR